MRYSYYPGCSLHSTALEYDQSTQMIFRTLGIELKEVHDWNCCGASSAHTTNSYLSKALPLRNLVLAEKEGLDVIAPCAACYNILKTTDQLVRSGSSEGEDLNREVSKAVGVKYKGSIQVRHVLEVLTKPEVLQKVSSAVKNPLQGLKLAPYYGCLLTRPPREVSFETNPEQPVLMEQLLKKIGAQPLRWTHRTECCGASLSISRTELVINLTNRIMEAARRAGAQALVTACPLCFTNLDTRQQPGSQGLPVFFVTELAGLALGAAGQQWLHKHIIDPMPLLRSLNLSPAS